MRRRLLIAAFGLVGLLSGGVWYLRHAQAPARFTGFVEGEERVIRSEVTGRVREVLFAEGAHVPANATLAVLDDRDIQTRIESKQREIGVLDADIRTQEERITLVENTWKAELSARQADVRLAESATDLAEKTFERERTLVTKGVSAVQSLDDNRARRDQAHSALDRAREMLVRTQAEERNIALARHELSSLHERRELAESQLAELEVSHSKYTIHAPATATILQTQFIWPGELAQPGTAIVAVLDPADKYVQLYVPVAEVDTLQLGRRVTIELDSQPGRRVPGEISFVADKANFTPEKIETRSDRMGQVYRVKVRILADVESFQPGTEGNVYPTEASNDGAGHETHGTQQHAQGHTVDSAIE